MKSHWPSFRAVEQHSGVTAVLDAADVISGQAAELVVVTGERDAALHKVEELEGRLIAASEEIRALRVTVADLQARRKRQMRVSRG